jgi:signal peptidase
VPRTRLCSRPRTLWSRLLTVLLLGAGFAVLALAFAVRLAGLHFQTVLTNSMRPTFSAGDVVVTRPVSIGSVQVGDVIAFQPPNGSEPLIHRVTSEKDGVIRTRGDANPVNDPWKVRLEGSTAYRLIAVLPGLGWLATLQRPLLLLAALVALLAIALELRNVVQARNKRAVPEPRP